MLPNAKYKKRSVLKHLIVNTYKSKIEIENLILITDVAMFFIHCYG